MLVVLLGAQCVALGALDVLYVELARGVLHRGGDWAGYLGGAAGAGGVLAVAFTARLVGRPRLAGPLAGSIAIWSVAFLGLAVVPGVGAALGLLLLAGGAEKTFDVTGRMLLQRVARSDALAGVFGLLEGLQNGGYAVGSLLAPALVALGGAPAAFIGVGAILPLVALVTGRRLLDIDRHATVPIVEIALLRSMPMFAALPPATLESLARALEPVAIPAGTDVIRQGEHGDRFYVIADGEVDVVVSGHNVSTLRRGDGFGEIALLNDVPRTATVTARTEVHLYALEREIFLVTLTGHAASHRSAHELAEQRLAGARAGRLIRGGGMVGSAMPTTGRAAPGYTADKDKLLKRLARIEGQVRGVSRMIEDDRYCIDILTQLGAVDTALEAVAIKVLEDHVQHCVAAALASGDEGDASAKAAELLDAVQRFAKTR